jgi:hypothetical protein
MLKKNLGRLDRTLRLVAAVALALIGLFPLGGWQGHSAGTDVVLFALWPLLTGLFGFCGIYRLLGISTVEKA